MEKIRHKHTLAKNHFSKMPVMAKYFKAESAAFGGQWRRPSTGMGSAGSSGGRSSSSSGSEMKQDNVGVNGRAVTMAAAAQQT